MKRQRPRGSVARARVTPGAPLMERYQPPTGDEPLDEVQQALVRMFIDLVVADILREEADAADREAAGRTEFYASPMEDGERRKGGRKGGR